MSLEKYLKDSAKINAAGLLLKTLPHTSRAVQLASFRAAARGLMEVSAELPDVFIVNVATLFVTGEKSKINREALLDIVKEEAKAAGIRILPRVEPIPDTAPDTVVTSSPGPVNIGVDLADGPDATSVAVCDSASS